MPGGKGSLHMAPNVDPVLLPDSVRLYCQDSLLTALATQAPEAYMRLQTYATQSTTLTLTVLPDLAPDNALPVGTHLRTRNVVFPFAPGFDLGCGYSIWHLPLLRPEHCTAQLANQLARRAGAVTAPPPDTWLGTPQGENTAGHDLETQLHATLLSEAQRCTGLATGNHYLELHRAEPYSGTVLLIHNGGLYVSRAVQRAALRIASRGEAITAAQLPLLSLDARRPTGRAYARWTTWAQTFAMQLRKQLAQMVFDEVGVSGTLISDLMHSGVTLNRDVWEIYSGSQRLVPGMMAFIGGQVGGHGHLVQAAPGHEEVVISHGSSSMVTFNPPAQEAPGVFFNFNPPSTEWSRYATADVSMNLLAAHGLIRPVARTVPLVVVKL